MENVTTTALVNEDHTVTIRLPENVRPGMHTILVIIDPSASNASLNLPFGQYVIEEESIPLRRKDIYGDDGR